MGKTTLTWAYDGLAGEGFKIYRADSPMDPENLPLPIATVGIEDREYVDETVVDDETYYYRVASYIGGTERLSEEIEHIAEESGDPHWDNVVSLLHFDGDLTDEKGSAWTGAGAIVPDGRFQAGVNTSAAYIQTPTAPWNDLSSSQGDFTVEMFIKQTAPNTASALIAHLLGSRGSFPFTIAFGKVGTTTFNNQLYFGHYNGTWIGANSTWEPVSDQWHHIAASREGAVYRLFADGVLIASFTNSAAATVNASVLQIGRRWDIPPSGNALFQGVIDELRITKGVARYTEDFTPPPEPFPDFGTRPPAPILPDPYWDNVVSLLHFDGGFTDEKGIEWVATGAVTTTNVKMFGGSGKFSGNPDRLELMNTDGFDFGTGEFTVEAFINPDSFSNFPVIFSRQTAGTIPGIAFQIRLTASGAIDVVLRETSTIITLTSTAVLAIGEWAHVVVQRDSDWSVDVYINGTKSGSAECPYNLSSDRPVGVGYLAGGSYGSHFIGHLDELRVTRGVARYTENFTPPTKPFPNIGPPEPTLPDPYWDNVVSLLHFDGDLTDETGRIWTPIGSPAFADTAPMLDGEYLSQGGVASSGIILGVEDFTIECFFRVKSTPTYVFLWDGRGAGGGDGPYPVVYVHGSTMILRNHVNNGSTGPSSSVAVALNTSYHFAHVRESGVSTFYLDGVNVGSATDATNYGLVSLHVAYSSGFGNPLDMDEFRITKGVARYTENFTPPTGAFPNFGPPEPVLPDPYWDNVVALLHFDGPDGSTTFTDDTGTLWAGQGDAKITTAVPGPFGGACAAFSGGGRILSEVAEKLALGTEDFTLECFVRRSFSGVLFDNRFGAYGSPLPISVPNSRTDIVFRDTLPGTLNTSSLLASDWYHYALVRDGGTVRQYLSGAQQDGEYTSLDSYTNTQVCIGAAYLAPDIAGFRGYLAEFRITKGVARYTENFTPPTKPFPNIGPYPTIIGEAFGGGYYIGDVVVADGGDDDGTYAVIMAGPEGQTGDRLKTSSSTTPGTASVTNGLANTAAMYDDDPVAHEAAAYCVSYEGGGFSDWYIPSIDELRLAWENRSELSAVAMAGQWYWSSTQVTPTSNTQLNKNLGTGNEYNSDKTGASYTRPVRRIKLPE